METTRELMPRARQDELVVEELQDETLVYDLKRHKATLVCPSQRRQTSAAVRFRQLAL